eukprot:TRINITY_DN1339_c0_g1_i1.p1 TRINITY_DN1339_c0_g1~~TRINITY_DN1339_c0_g1_i1.p1  ORF type:complete len:184 (+),score=16.63 TRINITY_DN1339_c0_g1_i1:167-718(+)
MEELCPRTKEHLCEALGGNHLLNLIATSSSFRSSSKHSLAWFAWCERRFGHQLIPSAWREKRLSQEAAAQAGDPEGYWHTEAVKRCQYPRSVPLFFGARSCVEISIPTADTTLPELVAVIESALESNMEFLCSEADRSARYSLRKVSHRSAHSGLMWSGRGGVRNVARVDIAQIQSGDRLDLY